MNHVLKKLPQICILLLFLAVTAGCNNLFGFASDKEKSPVKKAEAAIRDGDYTRAKEVLADEIETTDDSLVLYTYAKAVILEADIDVATIVDLVQGETTPEDGFNNPILEKFDLLDPETQNMWYKSNIEVSNVLYKIWDNQITGEIKKNDIALDYTVANVMSSILGLRDINQDQEINPDIDFDMDLISITVNDGGGFVLGNILKDENGVPIIDQNTGKPLNTGLLSFLGDWSAKASATTADTIKPDDINPFINFILTKLDEGEGSIRYLMDLYLDDGVSSIDYNEIQKYITDIGIYVNYYWYNDGLDNDGNNGADEETIDGIDNDGDGLIDEDTDWHPAGEIEVDITDYQQMFENWIERL